MHSVNATCANDECRFLHLHGDVGPFRRRTGVRSRECNFTTGHRDKLDCAPREPSATTQQRNVSANVEKRRCAE